MRSIILGVGAAAGLMLSFGASPVEMPESAKKLKCDACHSIEKKIVGPAWMDVSKAYNSNGTTASGKKVSDILAGKTAEESLLITVSEGGAGNWGTMPMPLNDADGSHQVEIRELVKFILSLAKQEASMAPALEINLPVPEEKQAAVPTIDNKAIVLALAKKYKCTSCHLMDKNSVGPSWMEISKVYNSKGRTRNGKKVSEILRFFSAEKLLLLNVSQGSSGNWGNNVMPANDPNYKNESGISKLIRAILDLPH